MKNESILTNVEERQNVFLKKVYLWMALGLAVTALAAFLTASSPFLVKYVTLNPIVTIICCVVEIVLVFILSGRIEKLSSGYFRCADRLDHAVIGNDEHCKISRKAKGQHRQKPYL